MNKQLIISKSIGLVTAIMVGACGLTAFGQTVAYTDAHLMTMGPLGQIENGTLLVRDGKIVDIGKDIQIPGDARVVSLQGKTVMPGIIDPYYVFKKTQSANSQQTFTFRGRVFRRPGTTFSVGSFNNVAENFYPYDVDFMPALRSGITTAQLVTDGRGLSAIAQPVPDPTPEMLLADTDGFLFAKVTNQTSALDTIRKNLAGESSSSSRGKSMTRAEMIARMRAARRGRSGTPPPTSEPAKKPEEKKAAPTKQETDPIKLMWKAVREGKKPLVVNANNAATVAHLNKLLEKSQDAKIHLVATGPNLFQSLDEIGNSKNITLVMQPTIDTVPYSSQLMNVPQMAHSKKIPFAISLSLNNSQMISSQDDPLFPIAMLVKSGLPRDTALQALTTRPAKMLGIDKTLGSLEKDKVANFLVFHGDPLETGSRLKQVFLMGKSVYER